jgi:hypothetical protein
MIYSPVLIKRKIMNANVYIDSEGYAMSGLNGIPTNV